MTEPVQKTMKDLVQGEKPLKLVLICVAGVTAFCALVSTGQGCYSSQVAISALEESRQIRFADNLPALEIGSLPCKKGEMVPDDGVSISNVGKGSATLILIGLQIKDKEYEHRTPHREYLTSSTPKRYFKDAHSELAKKYTEESGLNLPAKTNHYYVQYADIFENEYRQYFYFEKGDVIPGRFERIDKSSPEYRPVREPPGDN